MKLDHIAKRFRLDKPHKFRLAAHDSAECCGLTVDKAEAKALLTEGIERLSELQRRLYASDCWSVLIVLQAMDAAGKDSLIKHVMRGLNPQGVEVYSFKQPSVEELQHNFLWRVMRRLPARGHIGIFNRSHYEEVLTVRVHREHLNAERSPALDEKKIWQQRFDDIRAFEQHLARNGTLILKFFLNVSHAEQRKRFLARLDEPDKRWKFSMNDVAERKLWPKYMHAYEEMIRETSRPEAPWYILPADNKWFTWMAAAAAIVGALDTLKLDYPKVQGKAVQELNKARRALLHEK